MDLDLYLRRVGYRGSLELSAGTLRALHRAHLLAIPYENLDIHLGRALELDERRIFEKLVRERRGGWCYEMNGLFAWALRAAGFPVRLLAGTVNRSPLGGTVEGNHLVLLVELERPYLVDVGFGNGFLDPLPLADGEHRQGFLTYRLGRAGERWQFQNHAYGGPGFDFTLDPYDLPDFAAQSHVLQTAPDSGFVRLTVCHRFTPNGLLSLRGAVLTTTTEQGASTRTLASAAEYDAVLRGQFDLHIADSARLWEMVWARHQAWLGQMQA